MIKPMRAVALVTALCCVFGPPEADAQDTVTISLTQARVLARQALADGEPRKALDIATGLLQANPKDADTLLIISAAQAQLGNHRRGHKAARLAYRSAETQPIKLDAAVWAGRHALRDDRLTLTQIWLRRASLHAKSEADKTRIAEDYRRIRAANPWSFRFDFGVRPSNNVNNGSDNTSLVVDGIYTGGEFDGSAQALSGVVAHTDVSLGYRLHGTERSRTTLGARALVQRVHLSDEARELLDESRTPVSPVVSASDFGSTYVETSLSHAFAIGETKGNVAQVQVSVGGLWYGGDFYSRQARAEIERRWRLNDQSTFSLSGSVHRRDIDGSSTRDSVSIGLRGSYGRKLNNGDSLSLGFGVLDTQSSFSNNDYNTFSLSAGYSFGQQFGPAKISTSLVLTTSAYDSYTSGFVDDGVLVLRSGPRDDHAAYATVKLFFPDYDYAGFAPELTIRAGKRESNVSRFESSQLSISLGIQSKF